MQFIVFKVSYFCELIFRRIEELKVLRPTRLHFNGIERAPLLIAGPQKRPRGS